MNSHIWCELVTDFSRLEELSTQWQRWISDNPQVTIFQRWEWVSAFWKAHGSSLSLCSLAVHQNEKILGILPLVRRGERIEFLGSPDSDYNDLLCEEGFEAPVLETALNFLLQSPIQWKSGLLNNIPEHSRIIRTIPALSPKTRRHLQLAFQCPSAALVIDQNRIEMLEALINKDQLKRYHKKLQKVGSLAFRHFQTRDEAREHLDRCFQQHITRWAMNGQRSQFLQKDCRALYEALIEEFDPRKQLRFGVLELDSQPIAYHFGFQLDGTLTWYKPAFDVNYWEYCPGEVLIRSLLQYAKEEALAEFDFTLGDEPFKGRFANQVRQNYVLHLERHPAHIRSRFRAVWRRAEHVVRQKPEWKAFLKDKVRRLDDFAFHLRRLHGGVSLVQNCLNIARMVCGWIWSRDEVLFHASLGKTNVAASAVDIVPGTLDDIASLSVEFGFFLNAKELAEYRRRLKQGDRLFIARGPSGEAWVFWLRWRSEITVRELGSDCKLPLSAPSLVVEECWTAPHAGVRQVPAEALRALVGHLAGNQIWIYHVHGRGSLDQAIKDAGLDFRYRFIRRGFLRRFRRSLVTAPANSDEPRQEEPGEVIGASS